MGNKNHYFTKRTIISNIVACVTRTTPRRTNLSEVEEELTHLEVLLESGLLVSPALLPELPSQLPS